MLADTFLSGAAERLFDRGKLPGALDAWTGTLAFSGQIFCDFAGYSTTAIGAALCLGFCMPDNFRFPYAAVGFSDFWRRWHITLLLVAFATICTFRSAAAVTAPEERTSR